MAQRCVSGMQHVYGSDAGGQFFSRFLIEWLAYIVGWPVVDLISSGGKWDNVAASGTATASATAQNILEITSPGYAFTSANIDWFITLTGYSGGDEKFNGIYKIKKYLGSVGSVYTVELQPYGVHHDGTPVQSGLDWRLWAGTTSYCPTTDGDTAVLEGVGHTGAGLNNGARSSVTLGIAQAGSTSTLTDAGATFLASDVGKKITVSGSSVSGNNDTFVIATRVSDTEITYNNPSGDNDASFTGSWAITYPFHLHFKFYTAEGCGRITVAPYASWNATSHAWDDTRYTSEIGFNVGDYQGVYQYVWFWAEADTDHFTFLIHVMNSDYNLKRMRCCAVGELNSFHPEVDPRPIWSWAGVDAGWSELNYFSGDKASQPIFGYTLNGETLWDFNYIDRFRGLAYDEVTTLSYYASFTHCVGSANSNVHLWPYRNFSKFSDKIYLSPIVLESRTSNFMEFRGTLRNIWICNASLPLLREMGIDGSYLHLSRSVMVPWHGAKLNSPFTGYQTIG